ncbi:MAG: hypothetical protein HQ472_10840 [Ignavibacteria bacterium]|nr:hypothetical protein [Ignavibacteria bacterium]
MKFLGKVVLVCACTPLFITLLVGCKDDPVQPYATNVKIVFKRSDGMKFDSMYYSLHYELEGRVDGGSDKGQWVEREGDSVVTTINVGKTTDIGYFVLRINPFSKDDKGQSYYSEIKTPWIIHPINTLYRYEFFDIDSIVLTVR